jgi:quercetin dioxygenase-like cupin family protein
MGSDKSRCEKKEAKQELPHDPGRSLTASVVALAPGATAASHRHAGIVFASVLEPPGTVHTRTEHPSQTMPAHHLAVFIAPTGAQLTTVDKERCQELDLIHC